MGDPLAAGIRFALYASLGLLFGLAIFASHGLPAGCRPAWQRSIGPLLFSLVLVASAASVAGLYVMASRMLALPLRSVDCEALGMVLGLPGLGTAFRVRGAALALLTVALFLAPTRAVLPVLASAVALATLAWFGHAGASEGWMGWLHLGSTVLHLLSAGLWAGALAAFLLLVARRREGARAMLAGALGRFHLTGSAVVAALLATGLANALLIVGVPPDPSILGSPWAQLMALKLAVFAAMLGLAALNRFRLVPALAAEAAHAPRQLGYSLRLEFGLALVILGLVAWIGLLSPMEV